MYMLRANIWHHLLISEFAILLLCQNNDTHRRYQMSAQHIGNTSWWKIEIATRYQRSDIQCVRPHLVSTYWKHHASVQMSEMMSTLESERWYAHAALQTWIQRFDMQIGPQIGDLEFVYQNMISKSDTKQLGIPKLEIKLRGPLLNKKHRIPNVEANLWEASYTRRAELWKRKRIHGEETLNLPDHAKIDYDMLTLLYTQKQKDVETLNTLWKYAYTHRV